MLHLKQPHRLKSLCLLSVLTSLLLLAMLAVPAAAETKTPAANAPLEEARVYQMAHAKAADVESVLRRLLTPSTAESDSTEDISQAKEGLFIGPVGLTSDPRLNLLIVVTRPENFRFFDDLVTTLDKPKED